MIVSKKSTSALSYTDLAFFLGEKILKKKKITFTLCERLVSLVVQLVKNPPAMQETWVQSLGCDDLREKGMASHSSILAWRIPQTV